MYRLSKSPIGGSSYQHERFDVLVLQRLCYVIVKGSNRSLFRFTVKNFSMDKRSFCHHVVTSSFGGVAELAKRNVTQNTQGSLSLSDDVSSSRPCYCDLNVFMLIDVKKYALVLQAKCHVCEISKPNLWMCLHSNCTLVTCGESNEDHSSFHFQVEIFQHFYL